MKPLIFSDVLRTRICPKMVVAYAPSENPSMSSYNTHPYKISVQMVDGLTPILLSYADKTVRDKDLDLLDTMEFN